MDLEDCKKKGLIKRTNKDIPLIRSLIEMSDSKEVTVNEAKINQISISAYVSMAYDSLREVLEAICILNSYKVASHLCLGELLKELIKDFDFNIFDRFRYIRNGINYYGTKIDLSQGKQIISNMFQLRKELKKKYLSNIK